MVDLGMRAMFPDQRLDSAVDPFDAEGCLYACQPSELLDRTNLADGAGSELGPFAGVHR